MVVRCLVYPHCLKVADCNPCGASQIHIGVIKSGSSGRELTQEIMIIVTIVRTVSIAKNSPYRIERYRECYIVFANTISPLFTNQLQKRKNSKLEMFQVMIPKYYWEYRSQLLALDNYYHCCLILLV